jgi:integrase
MHGITLDMGGLSHYYPTVKLKMASIHKKFKSPYWYCEYRSADGRWLKKSTKLTDRDQARKWCDALQEAEDRIRRGSASEAQLRSIISASMAKITGRELTMPTTRKWLEEWFAAKQGANAAATLRKYKGAINGFLGFLGRKADGRLEAVTRGDIIEFRKLLREQGKSPKTVNQTLVTIAAPLTLAFKQGLILLDPTAGIPRSIDKAKKRRQPFTVEDVRRLLAVAEGDWKGAILAGYSTGMRLGDVTNLDWENIDLDNSVIAFHQRKTQSADDEKTIVGLHPDFEEWLADRKNPRGPIFPTLAGRRTGGRDGLSAKFINIMRKAGIESIVIRERQGLGRSVQEKSFHSLRHGAASHVFAGKHRETVKRVTGHGRGESHRHYLHVDLEAVRAATSLIPRL